MVAVEAMNIYMIHVVSSSEISIERYGQDAAILHTPFLTNLHHVNVHFSIVDMGIWIWMLVLFCLITADESLVKKLIVVCPITQTTNRD